MMKTQQYRLRTHVSWTEWEHIDRGARLTDLNVSFDEDVKAQGFTIVRLSIVFLNTEREAQFKDLADEYLRNKKKRHPFYNVWLNARYLKCHAIVHDALIVPVTFTGMITIPQN